MDRVGHEVIISVAAAAVAWFAGLFDVGAEAEAGVES